MQCVSFVETGLPKLQIFGIRTFIAFLFLRSHTITLTMIEHYELLAIYPGTKTEEEAQAAVAALQEVLQQHGANVTLHEFWGKRKLAYEIKHIRHGYYDLTEFDLETSNLSKLDNVLRLHEAVLRHQIIRKRLKTAEEIAAETALREKIAAKRQAAREKEHVEAVTADAVVPTTAPEPAEAAPIEKAKLDEKLEQIIDSKQVDI